MKNHIKLSIIILSYNTKELLDTTLRSVFKADTQGMNTEVIVVDNASVDGSPEMVEKKYPKAHLIKSRSNLGYAGGNNLGIKKAKGDLILFLNSDVEIKKNALVDTVSFMMKDIKFGTVCPKVDLVRGGMDPDCHRGFPTPWASMTYFLGLEKIFPKSRVFGQYHMGYKDLEIPHEIDAGFGTFMLINKEVIEKVGVWDEKYFFYGEDLDYFYRIKQGGWKVMFYPKVLALHHKGASSGLRKESKKVTLADRSTKIKTAKASIKAWEIFYKKFYKDKYPYFVTLIVILGIKAKGYIRLLKFKLF